MVYDSDHPEKASEEFAEVNEATRKPIQMRVTSLGKGFATGCTGRPGEQRLADPAARGSCQRRRDLEGEVRVRGAGRREDRKADAAPEVGTSFHVEVSRQRDRDNCDDDECLSPRVDPFQEAQVMQRKPAGTLKFDIARGCLVDRELKIDQRAVGFQGVGTLMTIRTVKIDRLVAADEASQFNLKRPLMSVQTAFGGAATSPLRLDVQRPFRLLRWHDSLLRVPKDRKSPGRGGHAHASRATVERAADPARQPIVFFGRAPECDVVLLDSRKVSRKHCCIAQIDDHFVISRPRAA